MVLNLETLLHPNIYKNRPSFSFLVFIFDMIISLKMINNFHLKLTWNFGNIAVTNGFWKRRISLEFMSRSENRFWNSCFNSAMTRTAKLVGNCLSVSLLNSSQHGKRIKLQSYALTIVSRSRDKITRKNSWDIQIISYF